MEKELKTIIDVTDKTLKEWHFGRQLRNLVKEMATRGVKVTIVAIHTADTSWIYTPES